ncbi:hypothetical protein PD716_16145 [Vibrio gigantis]|uniref:hypothetical protein n=1 Tax=Vibrio gigantis TaxID=296199 RepID=UPI002FCC1738
MLRKIVNLIWNDRELLFYIHDEKIEYNNDNVVIIENEIEPNIKLDVSYRNQISRELKNGSYCLALLDDDVMSAYILISKKSTYISELDMDLLPDKDGCYVYAANTILEYRRRGLYRRLLEYACSKYDTVVIATDSKNVASKNAIESLGFKMKFSLVKSKRLLKSSYCVKL